MLLTIKLHFTLFFLAFVYLGLVMAPIRLYDFLRKLAHCYLNNIMNRPDGKSYLVILLYQLHRRGFLLWFLSERKAIQGVQILDVKNLSDSKTIYKT